MAVSLAEEAIAFLLDLAEQGEIDPWDVQVIDVIDRFLSQLAPQANTRDLSESGQAFVYAAMLVYLKAMALADPTEPDPEEELPEEDLEEDSLAAWPPLPLERVLKPRAAPRLSRTRPITLKELIQQLQELESVLDQRQEATKARPQRVSPKRALAAITQLAHPENLVEMTAELESILARLWQQGTDQIGFDHLVETFGAEHVATAPHPEPESDGLWPGEAHHPSDTPHRIQVFWSLLLMASRSQVELRQEEFYQDLSILPCRVGKLKEERIPEELPSTPDQGER